MTEFDVVDLFAGGAGGWHYALAPHAPRMVGLEIDLQAVATRVAAQALGVDPDWVLVSRRDSAARLAAHGPRRNRAAVEPAPTITGECWRWMWRHPDGHTEPLTPAQAGVLQGFPVGHPWQGPKTRVALQIGNAIPPQLAEAAYSAATGTGELLLPLAA